jgi:NAD(P)-dependent dehydrogenase (short-subunit alcohol dehydrogenase family)
MRNLEGKVVAIAGGATGIGAGIVRHLVREGAAVAVGDIDIAAGARLAAELNAAADRIMVARVDIDDADSVAAFVDQAAKRFGGLDAFHANYANYAHMAVDTNPVDTPTGAYDDTMRSNARGFFLCTKYAIPALLKRGGGTILYTSSEAAHVPFDVRVSYSMSKAAIHALMRHVAVKWGPDNIRANVIAPGLIVTPKNAAAIQGAARDQAIARLAVKTRLGREEDIGALTALLVSDDGAYITGQVISVDGGSSMRL